MNLVLPLLIVVAALAWRCWPRRGRDIPNADLHEAFHRELGRDGGFDA